MISLKGEHCRFIDFSFDGDFLLLKYNGIPCAAVIERRWSRPPIERHRIEGGLRGGAYL